MFPVSSCSRQDEMRLEATSRIGETMTRLLMSGLVAQEKFGKNLERDGTTLFSGPRKFPSSTEYRTFLEKGVIS